MEKEFQFAGFCNCKPREGKSADNIDPSNSAFVQFSLQNY